MPYFVALEVGEKFGVGGVGAFRHQLQCYTNLKLGWVVVRLGCNNYFYGCWDDCLNDCASDFGYYKVPEIVIVHQTFLYSR